MGLFDLLNGIAGARSTERMDVVGPSMPQPATLDQSAKSQGIIDSGAPGGLEATDVDRMSRPYFPVTPTESAMPAGVPPVPDVGSVAPVESLQQSVDNSGVPTSPALNLGTDASPLGPALGGPPPPIPMGGENPPSGIPNIPVVKEEQPHFVDAPTLVSTETSSSPTGPPLADKQEGQNDTAGIGFELPRLPLGEPSLTAQPLDTSVPLSPAGQNNGLEAIVQQVQGGGLNNSDQPEIRAGKQPVTAPGNSTVDLRTQTNELLGQSNLNLKELSPEDFKKLGEIIFDWLQKNGYLMKRE